MDLITLLTMLSKAKTISDTGYVFLNFDQTSTLLSEIMNHPSCNNCILIKTNLSCGIYRTALNYFNNLFMVFGKK